MNVDQRALAELLEESQDLQADAMRPTHEALDELVEPRGKSLGTEREPTVSRRAQARRALEFDDGATARRSGWLDVGRRTRVRGVGV